MKCPKCGNEISETTGKCVKCGKKGGTVKGMQFKHGMKWYKFLIYFLLFASAVGNGLSFISAILLMGRAGSYGWYYLIQMGAAIVLLFMAIIARSGLANFQKEGPKTLCTMYIVNAVYNVANLLIAYAIIGEMDDATLIKSIATVVGFIVMYTLNKIYFAKRSVYFS